MPPHPRPALLPTVRRAGAVAIGATASALALAAAPLPWPPGQARELTTWWTTVGTDGATVSLVRVVGVALAVWIAGGAVLGLVATVSRSPRWARLWRAAAPISFRRALAASVAISVAAPGAASAADDAPEIPLLSDLGPADRPDPPLPVLVDLGPLATDAETLPQPETAAVVDEAAAMWTVVAGDHLWRIAEETLGEREPDPDETALVDYWQQLIDANRAVIGDDVDLIHPGMVLTLPE